MTELEKRIKAKIPGDDTGIEIKKTMCDICTPGPQCGVDAYVKDGVIIKLEGTPGFPSNYGKLCTRGAAGRQYLYREDRIKTPMRRVGKKEEERFEPISWDEALNECARRLTEIKKKYGAESTVWITGYSKWYRPFLQRLAYSFGSPNYISESSVCNRAEVMSYKSLFGKAMKADIKNSDFIISWGSNKLVNGFPSGRRLVAFKEQGGVLVVIDPRMTHSAALLADVYLRPKSGTDGAVALAMANVIIENGKCDYAFIDKYVHGFKEYKEYVSSFTPEKAEEISGVPAQEIRRLANAFADAKRGVIMPGNGLTHRANGFNLHRAVLSLMAITGRVDRPGTLIPENDSYCHSDGGFVSLEKQFVHENEPVNCPAAVGTLRFPVWAQMVDEAQGMDLVNQIDTEQPYPLRAMACFGVNNRMYPESGKFLDAIDKLDFVVATDIFWTDVCRHADIVLPVSTSYERAEVKCYAGRFINYTQPAVGPVYDNRDDAQIIAELARRLDLPDELLRQGYEDCVKYIFSPAGIEDWEAVKASPFPVEVPNAMPYSFGSYLSERIKTSTGKIELYSELIAKYSHRGLKPLPEYYPGDDGADPFEYPLTLMSGVRLPNAMHSRVHDVPWLRSLRPFPAAELSVPDAKRLGIASGDRIRLSTGKGCITVIADITEAANEGEVHMYHGYREANVNSLIPDTHLDPYTGFPGYKQVRCRVDKT